MILNHELLEFNELFLKRIFHQISRIKMPAFLKLEK